MIKEWPKSLYRPAAAGGLESRSFASETDVPEGEGWTDYKAAKAAAAPAPVAPGRDRSEMERLQKQNAELLAKWNAAKAQAITEKTAAEEVRSSAVAAQTRVGELEEFLGGVGEDASCPEALKKAIGKILKKKPAAKAA